MDHLFAKLSRVLYVAAALALMVLTVTLLGLALHIAAAGLLSFESQPAIRGMLKAIGLIVLGIATLEIAKYLVEEAVIRNRQLHRTDEARRTLNKFLTTIIIALSLESLVFVFEVRTEGKGSLIDVAVLLAVDVLMFVGLALFQWLIRKAEAIPVPHQDGRQPSED
ncbi:hypothetical protein [Azospirillum sp. SYSU D00513]|uniref:hypothetical protein n=1 Tax=Azospirillum sp. SYSU D00513 TaxID=2812561 RepID=UPI001A96C8EB|nr:hypothetical protein [Azospirillum sp. SYSU D00513]